MSQVQAMRRRQSMRRDIVKQGYLKKLPNAAKVGSSLRVRDLRLLIVYQQRNRQNVDISD